jgi:2-phosphosulfolactate phosphatase
VARRQTLDPFDQHDYRYRFDWGPMGMRRLAAVCDVVVIVDVLSFTTSVEVAVSRGAHVYPYRWDDGTEVEYAREIEALLAVPRDEISDEHPYSLSPASLMEIPHGSRLVLPSPNGSALAFGAAERAGRPTAPASGLVVAACLRNAVSVGLHVGSAPTVGIVAAGERWNSARGPLRVALEDLIGAGAVLAQLDPDGLSPEARVAVGAFDGVVGALAPVLEECASGRQLISQGRADDVALASEFDISRTVPVLQAGAFRRA